MPFKMKCWIALEVAPENDEIYVNRADAQVALEQAEMMQPENKYEIVESECN